MTEFSIPLRKVYLSPIIDCFDGMDKNMAVAELTRSISKTGCYPDNVAFR